METFSSLSLDHEGSACSSMDQKHVGDPSPQTKEETRMDIELAGVLGGHTGSKSPGGVHI